ncbi:hypothetical protein VTL71DRAFT_4139 [Oculimacula yallundae]|uniref:ER transporter 6TM N-terminal domain-containing protein n=1 Tax=Oculimacula yallundae TaxID=86028 RepID=A0ABR4C6T5_9HELO
MSNFSQQNESGNLDNVDTTSNSTKIDSRPLETAEKSQKPPRQLRDDDHNDIQPETTTEKPFILLRLWKKLGITPLVFMIMVKPAISAVIAMAVYQKHSVAVHYLNLGYLIIIISIITVPILPRGKYLMNLFLCLSLTCLGAGMVYLGIWAGVKARQNTTSPEAPLAVAHGYNSSASAVNAIFLMINIFGINTLRASRPSLKIPAIQYNIFVLVGFIYGPNQATVAHARRFTKELFYAFLTGQAISTGVALFIIPVSSRKVFFSGVIGFLQSCRALLKTQLDFVRALEHSKMCDTPLEDGSGLQTEDNVKLQADHRDIFERKLKALKTASTSILTQGAKLRDDVIFAKRETAYGSLTETDIHHVHQFLRDIMIPISGLSTIGDIAEKMSEGNDVPSEFRIIGKKSEDSFQDEPKDWLELIDAVHGSFDSMVQVLDESIVHILISLKLIPAPATSSSDVEKSAANPRPGQLGFGDFLQQKIEELRAQRSTHLRSWAEERGLSSIFQTTTQNYASSPMQVNSQKLSPEATAREELASKRLHVVLYMEFLMYSTSLAILKFVRFSELKSLDGTFDRKHLILPKLKTIVKWVRGLLNGQDTDPISNVDQSAVAEPVYLGDSFKASRDPEHLPPQSRWQMFGEHIRAIPRFLSSDSVRFGVRVTLAVMSVAVMCYVKQTHRFFIRQRIVWCLVMIAIGMNPSSGSSVFVLAGNLFVTFTGMVTAYINWYIVDQKTAGVIVLFPFFLMFYFYFVAKHPRFLIPIVSGCLAHVLIIGYELQTRVIGLKAATATGQPYYPLYKLAPYRLLTVGAGVIVAYIWTIFPVPITEGSVIRRNLGTSLHNLAQYLSGVTATVDSRLDEGGAEVPRRRIEKLTRKALEKEIELLGSMRQNLSFLPWEPTLGGRFPTEIYMSLIEEVQNITNFLTIIAYASESFPASRAKSPWLAQFASNRSFTDRKSHEVTTILALLSASLANSQALPPYLRAPTSFRISDQLIGEGVSVLDLNNLNEPGFRAIAVIEVAQGCVAGSTQRIVNLVKELVGELDFSYSMGHPSGNSSLLGNDADGEEGLPDREV